MVIGGGGGGFQKIIKDSSFVGVAATPLKPLSSCYVSCEAEWGRSR